MGKIEKIVQRNKYLCAMVGYARRIVWYTTGMGAQPGAHVILEDRKTGRILTVRPSSEWLTSILSGHPILHLPGGGVDRGETPREAAERECKEELGIELDLSAAEEWDAEVCYGLLRMYITVFRHVVSADELQLKAGHPPELLEAPAWVKREMAHAWATPTTKPLIKQAYPATVPA